MTAAIRTQGLTKKYRRLTALAGVDLDVQEGAIYALVGQNGAGKNYRHQNSYEFDRGDARSRESSRH